MLGGTLEGAILRQRIERLEALLALSTFGGSASGATFAGPIVANEAAAQAVILADGEQIFVLSHRSIWTKRNGVAGTQGVPPLAAHEVIATADLTGVLTRTEYSDPALRIGINDIWIDPANPAADDENSGLDAAAPLQTGYELFRRWGWNASKPIVGCNLATSPDGFVTIHVQSNLTTPDTLPIKVTIAANNSGLRVTAPLLAANILRTATLTDAVIAMNPAAPLGGVRLTIRDNTLVSWAAFEVANRRVRFTNGPAVGGTLQPQLDTVATPGQVQCSACQTTNEPGFAQVPTTVTPAVGNTYVVESLVIVNFGEMDIDQEINTGFGGFDVFINIVNCNLPSTGLQFWTPRVQTGSLGPFLNFYQCTIDRICDFGQAGGCVPVASYFTEGFRKIGGSGFGVVEGGGFNATATTQSPIIFFSSESLNAAIDSDFVANNLGLFSMIGVVRNVASWGVTGLAGLNTGGHGIIVGNIGPVSGQRGDVLFRGTIWGNLNTGAGLLISAACKGIGAPQNITGTQGDGKLANNPSVAGNNVYWQAATGLYVGATGVAGVASDFTWALLGAAKAAPGYGFSVHFPDQDASFVAAETTA